MVRRFQVAGLVFSLELPDNHPVSDLLHNYDPFTSFAGLTGESLFHLEMSNTAPGTPGEALLRPQEKTGEPVVGFFRSGDGYQASFAPGPGARVCGDLELKIQTPSVCDTSV